MRHSSARCGCQFLDSSRSPQSAWSLVFSDCRKSMGKWRDAPLPWGHHLIFSLLSLPYTPPLWPLSLRGWFMTGDGDGLAPPAYPHLIQLHWGFFRLVWLSQFRMLYRLSDREEIIWEGLNAFNISLTSSLFIVARNFAELDRLLVWLVFSQSQLIVVDHYFQYSPITSLLCLHNSSTKNIHNHFEPVAVTILFPTSPVTPPSSLIFSPRLALFSNLQNTHRPSLFSSVILPLFRLYSLDFPFSLSSFLSVSFSFLQNDLIVDRSSLPFHAFRPFIDLRFLIF